MTQTAGKIFISHAYADKSLATLFRNTLVLGGIPNERIFFSSERSTGIPTGRSVEGHLKSELQISSLVIELISTTFLTRPTCLMELGGAWALEIPTFPIVVPPLTRPKVTEKIGNVHLGDLSDTNGIEILFSELSDRIGECLSISSKSSAWNEAVRIFKRGLNKSLADAAEAQESQALTEARGSSSSTDHTSHGKEFTSSNYSIKDDEFSTKVFGELTNNHTRAHTYIDLRCVFYDSKRRIVGMADGTVRQIQAKETKAFELRSDEPIKSYTNYTIQVDSFD